MDNFFKYVFQQNEGNEIFTMLTKIARNRNMIENRMLDPKSLIFFSHYIESNTEVALKLINYCIGYALVFR